MTLPTLFDPRPPDPGDDAAPLAGGASVNKPTGHRENTAQDVAPPASRNAPPGTSDVAAARIASHTAELRDRILRFVTSRGVHGATDDEGETTLGIMAQTYTPRRGELVRQGLLVDSRERRPTRSGRPATVWVTPEHASQALDLPDGRND